MTDFALEFIPGEGEPERKPSQPGRSWLDTLIDNLVGRDDGVMSPGEKLGTALNLGGESLTLGLVGDEAAAAADSVVGRGSYDERLAKYRGDEEQFFDENPLLATGSVLAPAMIPGAGAGSAIVRAPSLAGKMAAGGAAGALAGGTYGFMEGEGGLEERKGSAATGAALSAPLAAAAPAAGRVVDALRKGAATRRANRALVRNAPSLDDLASRADEAYTRADRAAPIPRASFAGASDEILERARDAGYNPKLQDKSRVVLEEISEAANVQRGENIGFRELETLRRQAGSPAGMVSDRSEQAVGSAIIRGIDDFMDSVPEMGGEAGEARRLWTALRQTEMLDEAFDKASRAASGFENGLRVEFRRILNNPRLRRGLSDDTKAAMDSVVQGTAGSNFLKRVGRMMGPGVDQQSNMLGFGLSGAGGAAAAGAMGLPPWVGPIATGATGYLAQRGADAMTRRQAEIARAIAASGGKAPQVTSPELARVIQALGFGGGATSAGMIAPQ